MFVKDGFLIRALKLAYICNGVIPPENVEEDVRDPKREIARDMVHQMLRGSCSEETDSHSLFDLLASMNADDTDGLEEMDPTSMEEFLNLLRGNIDAE